MIEIHYLEGIPSAIPTSEDNLPRFHAITDQFLAVNPEGVLVARTYWGLLMFPLVQGAELNSTAEVSKRGKILELTMEGNIVVNTLWGEDIYKSLMSPVGKDGKILISESSEKEVVNG